MRLRNILLAGGLATTCSVQLAAQTCFGQAGYENHRFRAGGMVDVGDQYTSFVGSLGTGRPDGVQGSASLGYISPSVGDGGVVIAGQVSYEVKKPLGKSVRICPFAGIAHFSGDGSATDFAIGGSVGVPLNPNASGNLKMILTGGYTGVYERYSAGGGGLGTFTAEEWFGFFDGGVGFIVNQNLSLYPGVRVYLRYGGGRDPSIILRGNIGVGKR